MIVSEEEVQARYESPLNLLNRLKSGLSSKPTQNMIPSLPPTADKIIDDLEDKLKYGGLKSKAAAIMNTCLDELSDKIADVQKPEKLAAIIKEMNNVINVQEDRKDESEMPRYVIYAPSFIKEESFDTIYVKE